MLFHQDIVNIILYNMFGIGVIAGMGILMDIVRYLKRRSERTLHTNEGKYFGFIPHREPGRDDLTRPLERTV